MIFAIMTRPLPGKPPRKQNFGKNSTENTFVSHVFASLRPQKTKTLGKFSGRMELVLSGSHPAPSGY